MHNYLLLINGRNFLIERNGRLRKYGFFQNLCIQAPDRESAEAMATEKIRQSDVLIRDTRNDNDDPPMILVTSITEVDPSAPGGAGESDRVFYREKRWWQFWKYIPKP
jgi:hypothetical protein